MDMDNPRNHDDGWLDRHFRWCAQTIRIINNNLDYHDTDVIIATHETSSDSLKLHF